MSLTPVQMRCSRCGSGDFLQPSQPSPLDVVVCLMCARPHFFAAFIDQDSAAGRFTRCLFESTGQQCDAGGKYVPLPRHADAARP